MEKQEMEAIKAELNKYGFDVRLVNQIHERDLLKARHLELRERIVYDRDIANYKIHLYLNEQSGHHEIQQFDISLRREMSLPDRVIHGIGIFELDNRMKQINWFTFGKEAQDEESRHRAWEIYQDLWTLSYNGHPTGTEAQEKLILKYLADTPEAEEIANLDKIIARHEIQRTFQNHFPILFNARQAYNLLSGRPVAARMNQGTETITKWFQADEARDFEGQPVIKSIEGSERFDLNKLIDGLRIAGGINETIREKMIQSLMDGDQVALSEFLMGNKNLNIIVADPGNNQIKTDLHEMVSRGLIETTTLDQAILQQVPRNEIIIESLLSQMDRLGFGRENEKDIRKMVFNDEEFLKLKYKQKFGGDSVSYQINIKWNDTLGAYYITHVEAALKKGLFVPDEISTLDLEMASLNWDIDYYEENAKSERLLDLVLGPDQKKADAILESLSNIKENPGTVIQLRNLLEWKHWGGTTNERYIPDLWNSKQMFEISHKFEIQSSASVDANDMYHLLDGRAIEKMFPDGFGDGQYTSAFIALIESNNGAALNRVYSISVMDYLSHAGYWSFLYKGQDLNGISEKLSRGEAADIDFKIENEQNKARVYWDPLKQDMVVYDRDTTPGASFRNSNVFGLIDDLIKMGVTGSEKYVLRNAVNGLPFFDLRTGHKGEHDRTQFTISIQQSSRQGKYEFRSLDVSLLKDIRVPDNFMEGIDISKLKWEMAHHNWKEKDFWQGGESYTPGSASEENKQTRATAIFRDLDTLQSSLNKKAVWIAEALSMQHFNRTPNEYYLVQINKLKYHYEINHRFNLNEDNWLTSTKAYNLVNGRTVAIDNASDSQWAKLDFRNAIKGQPAFLKKLNRNESFDIQDILKINPVFNEIRNARIEERLKEGGVIVLGFPFEGKDNTIRFYTDPSLSKFIFTNADNGSTLNRFLSDTGKWEFQKNIEREIGQQRDYNIHPLAVNEQEFAFLKKDTRLAGFGETHDPEIREKMQIGYPEFSISHHEIISGREVNATLFFELAPETDLLEICKFKLDLSKDGLNLVRTFGIYEKEDESPVIDLQRAVNLLDGRAAQMKYWENRDNTERWYGLDLTGRLTDVIYPIEEIPSRGFDLETELSKYPIKELNDPASKEKLLAALKNGNIAEVTYSGNGTDENFYIHANIKKGCIEFNHELYAKQQYILPQPRSGPDQHSDEKNRRRRK